MPPLVQMPENTLMYDANATVCPNAWKDLSLLTIAKEKGRNF